MTLDGHHIRLGIKEQISLTGFQFSLRLPKEIKVSNISSRAINLEKADYKINEDVISFSYANADGIELAGIESIVDIEYRAETNQQLTQQDFSFDNDLLEAEIYNTSLYSFPLELVFERTNEIANEHFEIMQNSPNPFSNGTNIGFHIPNEGNVIINILQIDGQSIYEINQKFEKGWHSIPLDEELFRNNGVFLYYIEFGGERITNKMIKI